MNKLIRAAVLPVSSIMLFACGSESQFAEEDQLAQIAVINPISTSEGEEVNITASVTDPDMDAFTIRWEQIGGPEVTLSGTDTTSITFVAPWVSMEMETVSLEFRAHVNEDGHANISRIATVDVNAISIPPIISLPTVEQEAYALNDVLIECGAGDLDSENVQISVTNVNAADIPTQQFDSCPLNIDLSDASTSEPTYLQVIVEDEDGLQDSDSLFIKVLSLPKISDTGITTCIDDVQTGEENASNGLDCSLDLDAEGDRIPKGQDGHVGLSARKYRTNNSGFVYTKLNDNGVELPDSAEEWSCVRDDITGLVWEVKTDDGGLHDYSFRYGWMPTKTMMDAGIEGTVHAGNCSLEQCNTQSYVNAVNQAGLCGRSDWQMPDISELGGIIHYGKQEPAINSQFFINENTFGATWSSIPVVPTENFSGFLKTVWFSNGHLGPSHHSDSHKIRLVNRNFEQNGESK